MRIGIDVGGTKTRAVAIGPDTGVLAEVETYSGLVANGVVRQARETVRRLVAQCDDRVESFGIGIPGTVNFRSGVVSHAVHLGTGESALELGAELQDPADGTIVVDNDVNTAALGAYEHLVARVRGGRRPPARGVRRGAARNPTPERKSE